MKNKFNAKIKFLLLCAMIFLLSLVKANGLIDSRTSPAKKWIYSDLKKMANSQMSERYCYLRDTTPLVTTAGKTIQRIADSLKSINLHLPIEKVYLHTDRDSYNKATRYGSKLIWLIMPQIVLRALIIYCISS
jgi:hypothetical protein